MISLLIGVSVLLLAVIAGAVLDPIPSDPEGADERSSTTDLIRLSIWTVPAGTDRNGQPGFLTQGSSDTWQGLSAGMD